jgi:plasmid stabilization system protein ParE
MPAARRAALWSPEALDDRERIWDYYVGAAGRHTAEKVLRGIADVIALIEDHPLAGRARNEVRRGLAYLQLRRKGPVTEGEEADFFHWRVCRNNNASICELGCVSWLGALEAI